MAFDDIASEWQTNISVAQSSIVDWLHATSNINDTDNNDDAINGTKNSDLNNGTIDVPYEDYKYRPETYMVPIMFGIIFIVGVVGNGTLIIVFIRHRAMRNVPNTWVPLNCCFQVRTPCDIALPPYGHHIEHAKYFAPVLLRHTVPVNPWRCSPLDSPRIHIPH